MTTQEILQNQQNIINKVGGFVTDRVAVEINGELMYMTETQIRALQVYAKKSAELSLNAYNEFCKSVIVYSGRTKNTSDHIMHFRKDGKFVEEFDPGFYDVNFNLAFKIF